MRAAQPNLVTAAALRVLQQPHLHSLPPEPTGHPDSRCAHCWLSAALQSALMHLAVCQACAALAEPEHQGQPSHPALLCR